MDAVADHLHLFVPIGGLVVAVVVMLALGADTLVGAIAADLVGVPAAAQVGAVQVVLALGAAALVGAVAQPLLWPNAPH